MFAFKKSFGCVLAVLLVVFSVLSFFPVQAHAAEPVDVFYQKDSVNRNKVVAVQVASSGNLSNCETCVNRLREAGYNAWLYQSNGSKNYRVLVGVFSKAAEAEKLAVYMHSGPAVKGVKMEKAYATNAYISDEGMNRYCYPFYGCKIPETGIVSKDKDTTDIFYGSEGSKIVAVQVASSSSIANCKTCVRRLREAGYNAYLYQPKANGSYKILIGTFCHKEDSQDLIAELKSAPAVKGVKLSSAFATTAYVSEWAAEFYGYPYYSDELFADRMGQYQPSEPSTPSEPSRPSEKNPGYLVDCKVLKSTDQGGADIAVGTWKDTSGNSYEKSMKFWVRDGGGYVDTETITYQVNDGCISMTGWIAPSTKNDSKAKSTVNIYIDGSHVYQSPLIGSDSEPVFYEVVLGGFGGKIAVECTTDSNAFGHCIVSATLNPGVDVLPAPEESAASEYGSSVLEGMGVLLSWSSSRMTVEHLMPIDEESFLSCGEESYNIRGADICFDSEWGDDTRFTSLDAALKHNIKGWGRNIKELTDGEVKIAFWHDGENSDQIVLLYTD